MAQSPRPPAPPRQRKAYLDGETRRERAPVVGLIRARHTPQPHANGISPGGLLAALSGADLDPLMRQPLLQDERPQQLQQAAARLQQR